MVVAGRVWAELGLIERTGAAGARAGLEVGLARLWKGGELTLSPSFSPMNTGRLRGLLLRLRIGTLRCSARPLPQSRRERALIWIWTSRLSERQA